MIFVIDSLAHRYSERTRNSVVLVSLIETVVSSLREGAAKTKERHVTEKATLVVLLSMVDLVEVPKDLELTSLRLSSPERNPSNFLPFVLDCLNRM